MKQKTASKRIRGFSLAPKLHQKHTKKPLVRYVWRVVFSEFSPKKGELWKFRMFPHTFRTLMHAETR